MADDIEIDIKVELEQALKNLNELQKSIKAVKKSVDSELDPSINNTGTKIMGVGGKISGFGSKIKNAISGETALAFTALGAGMTSFTKQCIDGAIQSEQAWSRFGALVQQSGSGTWSKMSGDVKGWAKTFSNEMGYATSDTREAMTTLMQYGMTLEQTKSAMNGVAGLAARTGQTEAEAATMVTAALNGRFNQLSKVTGLQKEDYMLADGTIDKQKLLNDLYNQNTDAIKAHGETTEAQLNRINNSWGAFKTSIGNALMPAVKMLAEFVEGIVGWFNGLDKGQQTIVAVFLAIITVVTTAIGVLGMIAPIIINVGNLITSAGEWIGKLKIPSGVTGAWDSFKGKISTVKDKLTGLDLGGKLQGIRDSVQQSWTNISQRISTVKSKLTGMDLGGKLQGIRDNISQRWTDLGNRISNVKQRLSGMHLGERLNGIKSSVLQGWSTIRTRISSAKTALAGMHLGERLNGIKSAVLSGWQTFKSVVDSAKVALIGNAAAEGTSTASTIAHSIANGVRTAATTVATAAQTALNVATMAGLGPILLIVGAIAAFVAILGYLYFNNETVRNSINALVGILKGALMGAWNALSGIISTVANILQSTLGPAINFIMMAFQVLSSTIGQIINVFSRVMDGSMSLGDAFNAIGQILSNAGTLLWNAAMEAGRQMLEGFKTSVGQAVDGARTAVGGFIDSVVQYFTELPGKIVETLKNIPQMISDALSGLGNMVIPGGGLVAGILSLLAPLPMAIIGLVNQFFPQIAPALQGFIGNIVNAFMGVGSRILQAFLNIPAQLGVFFGLAVQQIQARLIQARAIAGMLIGLLVNAVVTRLRLIIARVRSIFTSVISAIRSRLSQGGNIAGNLANRIRQTIVTRFNQIIAKARSIFQNIVNTIRQRLANAVSTARDKALEIYNNIKNKVAEIPQAVADEFGKIPGKIQSALSDAASAAAAGAKNIVSQFLSGLQRASPGKIQRETVAEFNSLPVIIMNSGVLAAKETKNMAENIVGAWEDNIQPFTTPGLTLPNSDFNRMLQQQSLDLMSSMKLNVIGANYTGMSNVGRRGSMSQEFVTDNSTDDHATHIHIENIQLDCNNLTKQESRKILYDALDGLYTGGV